MNKLVPITLLFLLPTSLFGEIKIVPTEYSTIQGAIDVAITGDTVLVLAGTYFENINFLGKNIFLTSLIYLDGDTSFISNTIIDGNAAGSVVLFENGEDSTAVLNGFTITNGVSAQGGSGIRCNSSSSPILRNLHIYDNRNSSGAGGGIYAANSSNVRIENVVISGNISRTHAAGVYFDNSDPSFFNVIIKNNTSAFSGAGMFFKGSNPTLKDVLVTGNRVQDGGAGGISFGNSNPSLENVTVTDNYATTVGGGISFSNSIPTFDPINRSNIYLNHAPTATDLHSNLFSVINIVVDTFSVMNPSSMQAAPIDSFKFDILNAIYEQSESDLYVSPDGDDTNGGLSAGDPLKTITFALTKILADSVIPHTIYLSNGTYSPSSTREHFPLYMRDYVSLSGESKSGAILDAQGTGSVIRFDRDVGITLSNMTITGGSTLGAGGGIISNFSDPLLENVTISENFAGFGGGGIYFSNSNPILSGVTVRNNLSGRNGGGIYIENSNVNFNTENRSNIYLNRTDWLHGSDIVSVYSPYIESDFDTLFNPENLPVADVYLDTFTVLNPYDSHAHPRDKLNFDILNSKVESVISTDAILLTLRSQEGIRLDSSLAWKYQTALEGSYQLLDTMQYFRTSARWEARRLMIKSSDNIATPWKRGDLLTGDHLIDSLGAEYGIIDVRYKPLTSLPSLANLVSLFFRDPMEMSRLGDEYEKHPEVVWATPNHYGGGCGDIFDYVKNDSTYLIFINGWNDCLSGHYWYIASDSVGNAVYYGDIDRHHPPLVPIWNFPSRYQMSQFLTADSVYDVILNNPNWWFRRHAVEGMGLMFTKNSPPLSNEVDSIWYEMKDDLIKRTQETFFVLNSAKEDSDPDVRKSAEDVLEKFKIAISVKDEVSTTPDVFNLHQNYPNPFNPTTTIEYSLPKSSDVTLIVYNIVGQEVAQLADGIQQAGNHIIKWDASNVASGIYFYRLQAADFVQTRKMVLLK